MKENIIQKKSYAFALRIIGLYKYLSGQKKEYVLSKQILRCGTSIGANVEEAIGGQSKKDFLNKISIAYKETRETAYWLKLLRDADYLTPHQFADICGGLEEIQKIIAKIQKTTKGRL